MHATGRARYLGGVTDERAAPRRIQPIAAASGAEVLVGGRRLVSFAGCDSLGLARHPDVVAAAQEALARCGVSASASRTTTGTFEEHVRLEAAVAAYMATEDAVVLPSGWMSAAALVRALVPPARAVVVDADAHPAVREAAAASGVDVVTYAHFDAADAERVAEPLVGGRPLHLTCSVDLVTGAVAPLAELARAAEELAGVLVVDDAHGVGVLGAHGRGAVEHRGATASHVHVAGTLGKAFGVAGGFVAGSRAVCDAVRARAPCYAGTTPLPPALAAAARRALELASDGALRERLRRVCELARERLGALGLRVPAEPVPWLAVADRDAASLRRIERACADAGLLVPYVRYDGAPAEGCLRIALSAAHTDEHIARLAAALAPAS